MVGAFICWTLLLQVWPTPKTFPFRAEKPPSWSCDFTFGSLVFGGSIQGITAAQLLDLFVTYSKTIQFLWCLSSWTLPFIFWSFQSKRPGLTLTIFRCWFNQDHGIPLVWTYAGCMVTWSLTSEGLNFHTAARSSTLQLPHKSNGQKDGGCAVSEDRFGQDGNKNASNAEWGFPPITPSTTSEQSCTPIFLNTNIN